MTTQTYTTPYLTDLIQSTSAPDFSRFQSADRDEIAAIVAELEAVPEVNVVDVDELRGDFIRAAQALADYDAGADILTARDEDGWWFAVRNADLSVED